MTPARASSQPPRRSRHQRTAASTSNARAIPAMNLRAPGWQIDEVHGAGGVRAAGEALGAKRQEDHFQRQQRRRRRRQLRPERPGLAGQQQVFLVRAPP